MTKFDYLHSKNCKVLSQIKGHSVNKFVISVKGCYCDYSPQTAKNPAMLLVPEYVFRASIMAIKNRSVMPCA